jgi:hypothetical protein
MLDDHFIYSKTSELKIKLWWKNKLILYNIIVGFFGVLIVAVETIFLNHSLFWWLKLLPGIFSFGILANMGFYLGQKLELNIFKLYPNYYSQDLARTIFWIGTIFSVFVLFWVEFQILERANSFK